MHIQHDYGPTSQNLMPNLGKFPAFFPVSREIRFGERFARDSTHQQGVQWFNPAAFAPPQPWTWGNSGRNILFGPGSAIWDISGKKSFTDSWNHKRTAETNNHNEARTCTDRLFTRYCPRRGDLLVEKNPSACPAFVARWTPNVITSLGF
jgi:hypothetical protein